MLNPPKNVSNGGIKNVSTDVFPCLYASQTETFAHVCFEGDSLNSENSWIKQLLKAHSNDKRDSRKGCLIVLLTWKKCTCGAPYLITRRHPHHTQMQIVSRLSFFFFFIKKILFFSVLHPEVNLKAQTFHRWITSVKKTFQWEFFCVQRGSVCCEGRPTEIIKFL